MKAFFSKIWDGIKAVCSTAWNWCVGHKVIAIVAASVLAVGTTCAIVLPIALHEHSYATEWSSDADNHWHDATCKHEEEKSDLAAHTYTNACDATCDVCGYTRTVGAHVYDNACDATCNVCGATRTPAEHVYDNACDASCNVCGATRTPAEHVYDNACDTACNVCGATRTITHDYADTLTAGDTTHWYACSVCGDKKDEAAHVFDKTVASSEYLKAAATTTTKAQYYKSCVCGKASDTEYFETDKTTGTLANIQDLSKTYDKVELANPTYETNSDGAVTIEWYQGDTKLDAKPVNAGTYKVKVIIAESATYTGISAEKEFTIAKKTLNYLELTKVYDGAGFIAYALGTEHGVVSGDVVVLTCDEEFDYDAGSYYFIDKTDDTSLTDAGIDRAFLSGADAGNYQFANQKVSGLDKYEMGGMLTVTPKVLTNISFANTIYKGSTDFTFLLSAVEGLVSGETFTLQVTTVSKHVGTAVEIASISYNNNNYSIDKSAITLNIVPKALNLLDIKFTYDGGNIASRFDLTAADGVIAGDDVYLLGDGWQSYDVAYDEYTLTDDFGSDDYDEGVTLFGADKGNYKFTYDTDGSVGKVTVLPYILDFTGEYVKDADGTHYFTFTQDVTWSYGGTDTVTVKIALMDLEGNGITAPGVYTQENAQIGGESFSIGGKKIEGFELDEDYYADEFKVTVHSTDDLIMVVSDVFTIEEEFIIVVTVKQGTVKVGDSIVLPGGTDKVYEVLKIEKFQKQLESATVGEEVGLYVDGMVATSEVTRYSFLYEAGNIPEMATEFLAKAYLKTQAEGGRHTPAFDNYRPTFRGLGSPQTAIVTLIEYYGVAANAGVWTPGETMLIKITLTTPVPAALLHGLEFTMAEDDRVTVTGVVVDDFIGSKQSGNTIMQSDKFDTEALTPVVVKITNSRTQALDTLEVFVSDGIGGTYLTDFTLELYDEDFNKILGTHNNTEGTFTKDDSSTWSLAAGDTCYVVVKTTNATDDVFVRLM